MKSYRLCELIGDDYVILDAQATTKVGVIQELVSRLCSIGGLEPGYMESITSAVLKRESAMSTGIGFGIAVPHAAMDCVSKANALIAVLKNGVNFDSLDGEPVRILVLFVAEHKNFQKYLKTLADIAHLLNSPEVRTSLLNASSKDEVLSIIRSN